MRRKGQLLSIDALLSLVIVVMVVGVVMNTNDMIKAEITGLLDWYDRANIANNMLDVLTKNPGYPENWEEDVSSVRMVGLRDNDYPFALDYEKILALNRSKEDVTSILNQLVHGKDFLFEVYVSKFNLSVSGSFPKIYLNNVTFENPRGTPPGVNFNITKKESENPNRDNSWFEASYIEVRNIGGISYVNGDICGLLKGNNLVFDEKTGFYYLKFITLDSIWIKARRGQGGGENWISPSPLALPPGVVIEIFINPLTQSNFKITFSPNGCPQNGASPFIFKFTGNGNVVVSVSGYDNVFPTLNSSYTSVRDLLGAGETLYWFSLINGTFVDDINLIKSSMASSPWIEPVERTIVFPKFAYNLFSGPSAEEPLIYGFMRYNPLEGTSIRIRVNSTNYGNLTLLSKLGTEIRALFVYGNSTDLNATLVWYENGNATLKAYEGVNGTVTMSFEELFGSSDTTNKLIGLWLYSLEGWNRSDVTIEVVPTIEYMLEPKFEDVITKLWVWDDG
jgi:hypothetical protein